MSDDDSRSRLLKMLGGLRDFSTQRNMLGKMEDLVGSIEVTGEAGAGLVKVTLNGAYEATRVEIADPVMEDPRKEFIEALTAAAVTDASRKVALEIGNRTSDALQALGAAVAAELNKS